MDSFSVSTEIKMFTSIDEFVAYAKITPQDLLVVNASIYEPCLKAYKLKCRVICPKNYRAGEPTDIMINAMLRDLKDNAYERVIAVGGGTVIDAAKVLALSGVTNVLDALYGRIPLVKGHRLLIVPTTCGTGSEVTNISILEDTQAQVKKGIVSKAICPDEALLVPNLLQNLPYKYFAFSSIDALIHAIESYLSPASNVITEMFALAAIERLLAAYQQIAKCGPERRLDNIAQVLVASTLAGIAFGNTGVGAVHAMSYPLGGKYHVAHGEANYAFLDAVLRKYDEAHPAGKIYGLKTIIGNYLGVKDSEQAIGTLAETLNYIIPLKRLQAYGVKEQELESFARAAIAQERLMKNNYVPLSFEDVLNIYRTRY